MMEQSKFSDLRLRLISGAALALVALIAVGLGGWVLMLFAGVMLLGLTYELTLLGQSSVSRFGVLAMLLSVLGYASFNLTTLNLFAAAMFLGVMLCVFIGGVKPVRFAQVMAVMASTVAVIAWVFLRSETAILAFFGCALIVIASDIAGYFAGRLIGGPKLWEVLSPKKTWSGTIAGWVCGVVLGGLMLGAMFARWLDGAAFGLCLAMAAQVGDLFFSFLKRKAGVKDFSQLIPGHGGFGDRFDGFVGAGVLVAGYLIVASGA